MFGNNAFYVKLFIPRYRYASDFTTMYVETALEFVAISIPYRE
jgi:hypothetical protein